MKGLSQPMVFSAMCERLDAYKNCLRYLLLYYCCTLGG